MDYSFSSFWLQMRKDTMDISVLFSETKYFNFPKYPGIDTAGSYNRCKQKLKRTAKEFSSDSRYSTSLCVTSHFNISYSFCCSFINISYSNG